VDLFQILSRFASETGFQGLTPGAVLMIAVGALLIYLAVAKDFEPLLLVPIGFGAILTNLPLGGILAPPTSDSIGGLYHYLGQGIHLEIFPPLIFLGVGAMTDFGPLLARPTTFLLGAAAQVGVFTALLGAMALGFTPGEAASIGIIGGADGPTSIFLATKLAPQLLGPIAVASYSYMALVPVIQPPIMRLLVPRRERRINMGTMRIVSRREKIIFPIAVLVVGTLIVPPAAPLLGMLMFGNLLRESGVTSRLAATAQNELINIVTILLGSSVGVTMTADSFLRWSSIKILVMGAVAFAVATAGGVLLGRLFCLLSRGRINPLIGAAGVSAVPMSSRVVQKVGLEEDPQNHLLMHAMGPNVAGVIGTAVVAGFLLSVMH
jgi:oxaloacetate decarboxylase beta subunit